MMNDTLELVDRLTKANDRHIEAEKIRGTARDISTTYLLVLCALGIPGNASTILTIVSMGKINPGTLFVALLAVCDLLALISKLIGNNLASHNVDHTDAMCKLRFVPMLFSAMANWSLVLIAVERFFSVCYPLKKAYLFTKRRSLILTGLIFFVLFVIYLAVFVVNVEAHNTTNGCVVISEFMHHAWHWINATVFLFLPFGLSFGLSVLIIYGLATSRKERRSILMKNDGERRGTSQLNNMRLMKEAERAENMITIMLILASALFLILTLPACVYYLIYPGKGQDDVINAKWKLYEQIQYVCVDSTHALNFFVYFISAKRFRNQFISTVTCHKFPRNRRNYGSSNSTETSKLSTTSAAHAHSMQRLDACGSRENLSG